MQMSPRIPSFIDGLLSQGRACFSLEEARQGLGISDSAIRASTRRLKEKGELVSPYQKFFVVLPPEYRTMGCLPASHFIPDLMKYLNAPYYTCLLSAGEYYGAAHQRPQVFQVMTDKPRRFISCGRVRVQFLTKKNISCTETNDFNTPRGTISVSSPAFTAFDLVGYPTPSGGLNNVATVLSELSEGLTDKDLVQAAKLAPLAWAQRLGYILDFLGKSTVSRRLAEYLSAKKIGITGLTPGNSKDGFKIDSSWKVAINHQLEPDI